MKFVAPWWDPEYADSGAHGALAQKRTMQAAVGLCRQRRTAVDVGAHIGLWSAFLAERFEQVCAFEPVSENVTCYRQNVTAANVDLYHCALGDISATVHMEKHGTNSGCWHCVDNGATPMTLLDEYEFLNVDLLKLDVEGLEGRVLNGARRTLEASWPVVVLEANGLGERLYGEDWLDPKVLLRHYGYAVRGRIRKDEIWSR